MSDALYRSDDEVERAMCARREPPCGIVGEHTHGDAAGTFAGLPVTGGTLVP